MLKWPILWLGRCCRIELRDMLSNRLHARTTSVKAVTSADHAAASGFRCLLPSAKSHCKTASYAPLHRFHLLLLFYFFLFRIVDVYLFSLSISFRRFSLAERKK